MTIGLSFFLLFAGCGGGSIVQTHILPAITAVLPGTITAGTANAVLKVTGTNFSQQSVITWNGSALPTSVVDTNTLSSTVGASSLAQPSTAQLRVQNSQTNDESQPVPVIVAAASNVAPPVNSGTTSISIAPAGLPSATVGVAYSAAISAAGGVAPDHWVISSGKLPTGLTLSSSGAISGTPTVAGSYKFAATVTDSESSAKSATSQMTLAVSPTPVSVVTSSLPQAQQNYSYAATLQATGGTAPYTWSVAPDSVFPSGLTLSPTGALSGKPAYLGVHSLTFQVQDASAVRQTATVTLVYTCVPGASNLQITTPALPSATTTQAYNASVAVNGGTAPYTWSIASGSLPKGLSLNPSTGAIAGTPSTAGSVTFTANVADASSPAQVATANFTIAIAAATPSLSITTAALPNATQSTAYTQTLAAHGGTGPYTWSVASGSLPAGLSLNPSAGAVAGTPSASGTASFTAKVTDASFPAQAATANFTIAIAAATPTLSITTAALPNATQSTVYTQTLAAHGGTGPYTWSIASGSLPKGLSLNPSAGAVAGTPSASGTASFTAKVTDASSPAQAATANFTIAIAAVSPLSITTAALPNATQGVSYSQTLSAKGGTAPYVWSMTTVSPPIGLTLSSGGILSGVPSALGTAFLVISVHDSASPAQTALLAYPLTVLPGSISITTTSVPMGAQGTAYSQSLSASGGSAPYNWTISSGSLPAGLKLSSSGILSGTATASGKFVFGVTAQDAETPAQATTRTFGLTIAPEATTPLSISTASLPSGSDGVAYSTAMAASGGKQSYTWSITSGKLPAGLTLAATSGVISGTPSSAGTFTFTTTVSDNSSPVEQASLPMTIKVTNSPPVSVGPGATWFIRPDGGSRYSANAVDGQCDGRSDTPYQGSGTNQHCAFNDFRYLYDDKSYGGIFKGWVIAGGDTVIVRGCFNADDDGSGSTWCRIGFDPPGKPDSWCVGGDGAQMCSPGPIPAGSAVQHTRILGQNYATCGTATTTDRSMLTQLYGGNGLGHVLGLNGAQYVDVECFEITRHSQCIQHGQPAYPSGCQGGVDDFDSDGVATDATTSNVRLQDMWIHGHTDRGIIGPIGGTVTCLRCDISYNGMAGWDFDDGNQTSSAGATWNFLYSTIAWNGCNQEYPAVDKYPAISCYSQSTQGYGDGVGTPPGFCMNVNVDHSTFAYNTQDGIDLGHLNTVGPSGVCTLSITNSTAYGNNGASFKWGPAPTLALFANNFAEANCARMSKPLAGAPSTYNAHLADFCRAGDGVSFDFYQNSKLLMTNNTFVSYAPTTFDFMCGSNDCSNAVFYFENNVALGFTDYTFFGTDSYGGNGAPGGFCTESCNGSSAPVGTIIRKNNIYKGLWATCPTNNPSEFCEDPGFVNQPTANGSNFSESELDNFNFTPAATSPAIGAGIPIPGITLDYNGVTRPNPPAIGALQ